MEQEEKYYNKVLAENFIVPYVVVERYSLNTIRVKKMKCERTNYGWRCSPPQESEPVVNLRKHKDGKWYDACGVEYKPNKAPVRVDVTSKAK